MQLLEPFTRSGQSRYAPLNDDLAVKRFFAQGKFLNELRVFAPLKYFRNDNFIFHSETSFEVTFRERKPALFCEAFPTRFMMRRGVYQDAVPIKDCTNVHRWLSVGSAYIFCS